MTQGRAVVVALLFTLTAQLLRASGPMLDSTAGKIGISSVALLALATFALTGPLVAVGRRLPLVAVVATLAAVRFSAQAFPMLVLVLAGAVLGLVALALAVRQADNPVNAALGVLFGGVLDLTCRAVMVGSDVFASGLFLIAIFLLLLFLIGIVRTPAPVRLWVDGRKQDFTGRIWVLGAYLAIWTMTVGNPAFASSQSGQSLPVVLAVLMVALLPAMELIRRMTLTGASFAIPEPDHWIAGSSALLGLLVGLSLAWWSTGTLVLVGLVIAQWSMAVALVRAFAATADRRIWPYGLIWVLPVLLFQLHYDAPLPFDNRLLVLVPALLLGLAGMGRRPGHPGLGWVINWRGVFAAPAGITMVALLAPLITVPMLAFVQTNPGRAPRLDESGSVRVLTWNVRYGVGPDGVADPEQLDAMVSYGDVVVLQEVSRGWAIGGGVDLAENLARRNGMRYYWAPAADGQFGNLLLTRLPVRDVTTGRLPYGQGPMWRSYLKATVEVGGGRTLDVITTHLTHRKANTPTRLDQIDELLNQVGSGPTVIAGDLNFWPSWPEAREFTRAGFVSAQDVTGHGAKWTSSTDDPNNRVDWMWGRGVTFSAFEVVSEETTSDHFPLIATVTVG